MNYNEYKQQLKEELEAYKDKIKAKLDEFKEKQNLKLEKFKLKTKNNKKKSKSKSKSKRRTKGGALNHEEKELLESIILKLYYVILALYKKPSSYTNPITIIKSLYEYLILNDNEYGLLDSHKISSEDIDLILNEHIRNNNIYHRLSILDAIEGITNKEINDIITKFFKNFEGIKGINQYLNNSYPTLGMDNYMSELDKLDKLPYITLMKKYLNDLKSKIEPYFDEEKIIETIRQYNRTLSPVDLTTLSNILNGEYGVNLRTKYHSLFADIINDYPFKYTGETSKIINDNILSINFEATDVDEYITILPSIICKLYKTLYKYKLKTGRINCKICIEEMSLNDIEIYTIEGIDEELILTILEGVYAKITEFDLTIHIDDLKTCFLSLYSSIKSKSIKKENNNLISINELRTILKNPILLYDLEKYPVLLSVLCKLYKTLYKYKLISSNKLETEILFRDINLNEEEIEELRKITEISGDHPLNDIIKKLVDTIDITKTTSNKHEFSIEMLPNFKLLVMETKKPNPRIQKKTAKLMTFDKLKAYIDLLSSKHSYTEEVKLDIISDEDRKNIDNLYKLYKAYFESFGLTLDNLMILYILIYKIFIIAIDNSINDYTTDTYYLHNFIEGTGENIKKEIEEIMKENEGILSIIFDSKFYNEIGEVLIFTIIGTIDKKEKIKSKLKNDPIKKITDYFNVYLKNKYQNPTLRPVISGLPKPEAAKPSGEGSGYGFNLNRYPSYKPLHSRPSPAESDRLIRDLVRSSSLGSIDRHKEGR